MGSVGDFYLIDMSGIHDSQQDFHMTKYYIATNQGTAEPSAPDLSDAFKNAIGAEVAHLLSNDWTINRVNVRNLLVPTDFSDTPYAPGSDLSGTGLPPVLAVGFRSPNKGTNLNRSGHQLPLGGVDWVAGDGSMTEEARDSCYFLQQQLGLNLIDANNAQYVPCTVNLTYTAKVLTNVTLRASMLGQWEINRWFTTRKTRQSYNWELAEEPIE